MVSHVPSSVLEGVKRILHIHDSLQLKDFAFSGGGCINHGGKLITTKGNFFLKWNDSKKFPGMFEAESKGLQLLRQPAAINIPQVIGFGEENSFQFLVLEFIEQRSRSKNYWQQLGEKLAQLHRQHSDTCGLDHDNYIGSLHQKNNQNTSWINFFIEQRLNVQLKMTENSGTVNSGWRKKFEALFLKLPALLPEEKPSLLHGDLWSGNLITDEKGEPCLIDPAVYYGNRETDLAMTKLFDGFDSEFYHCYNECFPLQKGFERRANLYNLYPLLVHVNLFGSSYKQSVENILDDFL
jgi:protein-ribulosamine 3-kinase